ncbi:MAG: hypothetical protein WA821_08990 [Anaerolineales bacterium]
MTTEKQATVFNPDAGQAPTGAVCIPNISTEERLKRLRFGVIAFAVAIAILVVLMVTGVSSWWRLLLFLPFAGAGTGFFQWRDKTCVGLSARQSRKLGDQMEKIEDPAELAQVRWQANRVQVKAFAAAVALTLIALLLP